jgi:hypothetical protein
VSQDPLDSLPPIDELLGHYDQAAAQLLDTARSDGHFSGEAEEAVRWPASPGIDLAGLERRAELIGQIFSGIPSRRDQRLAEAHAQHRDALPAYHRANRLYLQAQNQFIARDRGDAKAFLQLYQNIFLEALGRDESLVLDEGEAALAQLKVARAPLAHAKAVAGKVRQGPPSPEALLESYECGLDGQSAQAPLAEILAETAAAVIKAISAGEHLAIRYNTFNNFTWFGISVWKAITEVELQALRLQGKTRQAWLDKLLQYVRLGQGMLLKFFQAHSEDPAQIRPKDYWYGQQYSYLTRDMIDLTVGLVDKANALGRRGGLSPALELPPLLGGNFSGRFTEYSHVGRRGDFSTWGRRRRLLSWVRLYRRTGRQKQALRRADISPEQRLERAWALTGDWAARTLETFDVEVRLKIDPLFATAAAALELDRPGRRIVVFPTHQSLMDHPVMAHVLQHPDFVRAMGWEKPRPFTQLARAHLLEPARVRLGPLSFSLIGIDPDEVDRLFEEVDGMVIMERSKDTGNPTRRFAQLLDQRPGVVYGAGTTAAFELQCLPLQHALFGQLPEDTVFLPVALRGIHSLWPKCPRGNLDIGPGIVEAVLSPPMPGETTLLPRKRALRTQLEPATFFQAVQIADLLDPRAPEER